LIGIKTLSCGVWSIYTMAENGSAIQIGSKSIAPALRRALS
jgi:hypothetical protein